MIFRLRGRRRRRKPSCRSTPTSLRYVVKPSGPTHLVLFTSLKMQSKGHYQRPVPGCHSTSSFRRPGRAEAEEQPNKRLSPTIPLLLLLPSVLLLSLRPHFLPWSRRK